MPAHWTQSVCIRCLATQRHHRVAVKLFSCKTLKKRLAANQTTGTRVRDGPGVCGGEFAGTRTRDAGKARGARVRRGSSKYPGRSPQKRPLSPSSWRGASAQSCGISEVTANSIRCSIDSRGASAHNLPDWRIADTARLRNAEHARRTYSIHERGDARVTCFEFDIRRTQCASCRVHRNESQLTLR